MTDVSVLRPHTIPCPSCGATLHYGFLPGSIELSIQHPRPVCRFYTEAAMKRYIEDMIRCELDRS